MVSPATVMVAGLTGARLTQSTTFKGMPRTPKYRVMRVVLTVTVSETVRVEYPVAEVTKVYDLKPL
jgi:hypothetical protein